MADSRIIIVRHDGRSWTVTKPNAVRASGRYATRREAYSAARNIALNQGLKIKIYNLAGEHRTISPRDFAEDEDCFLTTACIKFYGLGDACYQLETLRQYRDTVLLNEDCGSEIIKQYYQIAPEIIEKIKNSGRSRAYYRLIFLKINKSCQHIEKGEFQMAKSIYVQMIKFLVYKLELLYGDQR